MSNPYQPPSTTNTTAHTQQSIPISWIAFLAVCGLVSKLSYGNAFVTVIVISVVGATILPFLRPSVRRKRVWGGVSGLVLSIICPIVFLYITMEPPSTYATSAAFRDRLELILAFTIPIGVWAGAFVSDRPRNGNVPNAN